MPPRKQRATRRLITVSQNSTFRQKFAQQIVSVTGAAGTAGTFIPTNSVASAANWTNFKNAFGPVTAYVVTMRVSYLPYFDSGSVSGSGVGYAAPVNEDSTPTITSADTVISVFQDFQPVRVGAPFRVVWKAQSVSDRSPDILNAGLNNKGGVAIWFQGAANSITTGQFLVETLVEVTRS